MEGQFHLSSSSSIDYSVVPSAATVQLSFTCSNIPSPAIIHWATGHAKASEWLVPEEEAFVVSGVTRRVAGAFQSDVDGDGKVVLVFRRPIPVWFVFVVNCGGQQWLKNGTDNFVIHLQKIVQDSDASEQLRQHVDKAQEELKDKAVERIKWTVPARPSDFRLEILVVTGDDEVSLACYCDSSALLVLHWGYVEGSSWTAPAAFLQGSSPTHPWDERAVQTCFQFCSSSGQSSVQSCHLRLSVDTLSSSVGFVLKEQLANRWYKCEGDTNFSFELPAKPEWEPLKQRRVSEMAMLKQKEEEEEKTKLSLWHSALEKFRSSADKRRQLGVVFYRSFELSGDIGVLDVSVYASADQQKLHVSFCGCFHSPCQLHWGVEETVGQRNKRKGAEDWRCPAEPMRPANTTVADPLRSCDTPFVPSPSCPQLQTLEVLVACCPCPKSTEDDAGIRPEVGGIVCVLRDSAERWYKQRDNTDMQIRLVGSTVPEWRDDHSEVVEKIVQAEVDWNHMTLMHRYNLMRELMSSWDIDRPEEMRSPKHDLQTVMEWSSLFKAEEVRTFPANSSITGSVIFPPDLSDRSDREFWSWMFVWGRFAFLGLLDWQRNYNTKPKDLASATENVTHLVAQMWKNNPKCRPLIRLTLSTMSRGGNQGQAIRDRILDIMHKHKIPEHGANFYEQWHQKLHNNTTPDDVGICKAVIRFLQTGGNTGEYWKVLSDHSITRERLASYERKITSEPFMVGQPTEALIHDFSCYLSILQDVHDALDLEKAFTHARRFLSGDMQRGLDGIVSSCRGTCAGQMLRRQSFHGPNISEHEAQQKFITLSEIRRHLVFEMNKSDAGSDAIRELLFLDFALEQQQGLIIMGKKFSLHHLSQQIKDLFVNLSSQDPTNGELRCICSDWWNLAEKAAFNQFSGDSRENALLLKSLVDRVARIVGDMVDDWQTQFGAKSTYLGTQVGTDKKVLDIFVDETLRGSALFSISLCLKQIEPLLRAAAQLPPWQLISVVPTVQGELIVIDKLANIQVY
eukprot:GHVS01082845.1.p1 GENE.GHVS01082845.1~~GHVS01082845.1.p1  ORF type:complete len:1020 (+),score=190.88 GHVS01082845.1:133-3192(+)